MKVLYSLFIVLLLFSCKTEKEQASTTELNAYNVSNAVLDGGQLHRIDSFPSSFATPRIVDVWLPENYTKDKKYAVVYMHDGQNLFDATTTWNKQEWQVDEIGNKLMKEGTTRDFIVVGMHSIAKIRHFDYFPLKAFKLLSNKDQDSIIDSGRRQNPTVTLESFSGDKYLKFIVEEVKPYIDTTYATLKDPENTVIAGSSMGGLISMYAYCEYPEVFGKAACLSTHWPGFTPMGPNPVPEAFYKYLRENLPSPDSHMFYQDFGTATLDQYYARFEEPINEIFASKGYTEDNYLNLKFEGADHSEASWQQRFDVPLKFLLKK